MFPSNNSLEFGKRGRSPVARHAVIHGLSFYYNSWPRLIPPTAIWGSFSSFATVGTGISSAEDILHCASVVLKASCSVGISDSPILQALQKVVGDAGRTELLCRLPHPAAAEVTVGAAWSVILLDHRKRQVLRDGVLQSLFHPGSKQRLCQSAAYPGRKRSKERYPVGANPHYS